MELDSQLGQLRIAWYAYSGMILNCATASSKGTQKGKTKPPSNVSHEVEPQFTVRLAYIQQHA